MLLPTDEKRRPEALLLKGTSPDGPLELEISVQILDNPGETIHQLAAKKAVQELEEGRGWLQEAKLEDGTSVKDKFPSYMHELVRREAVRLGVKYQVGSKYCSFVAIEKDEVQSSSRSKETVNEDFKFIDADSDGITLAESTIEKDQKEQ